MAPREARGAEARPGASAAGPERAVDETKRDSAPDTAILLEHRFPACAAHADFAVRASRLLSTIGGGTFCIHQ